MFRSVFISIIFILPIGCISYKLFKYYFRNRESISILTSDNQLRKWKINLSLIGAIVCIVLAILWLAMVWVPENQLPLIVKLSFYILLIPCIVMFVVLFVFLNALGDTVKAGGPSTRSIIKNAIDAIKDEPSDNKRKV